MRREVGAGLRSLSSVQWPCEPWEGLGSGSDIIRPVFRRMTWAGKLWVRKAAWAGGYRVGVSNREKSHTAGCITPRLTISLVQRGIKPEAPDPSLPLRRACSLPHPCRLSCLSYVPGMRSPGGGGEDLFFSWIFLNA